jgi:hypothetical protein
MFHATIHTPSQGRLRLSGRAVPYDLEVLREHVYARGGPGTRVEVRLAPAARPALLRALRDVGRLGIELVVSG